ncbi:unnamed protein product [Hydatigera taeniaeformis]|uniref:Na_Ca_ex domain-containing protein n=1 Tax=Hydatigena taeniaeformis TaxID=6205 RepID=A0A0R3WJ99_HYDTA|nr:unnamed protein product [Hydatigera taeniaeformis]
MGVPLSILSAGANFFNLYLLHHDGVSARGTRLLLISVSSTETIFFVFTAIYCVLKMFYFKTFTHRLSSALLFYFPNIF